MSFAGRAGVALQGVNMWSIKPRIWKILVCQDHQIYDLRFTIYAAKSEAQVIAMTAYLVVSVLEWLGILKEAHP